MELIIEVKKGKCMVLHALTKYNSYYYYLPFEVNGCDVIHESFNSDVFNGYSIGIVTEEGVYVHRYFLNQEYNEHVFLFKSSEISKENTLA